MLTVFPATLAAGYGMAHALGQPSLFGLTYGGMVGLLVGLTIAGPKAGTLALRCVWGVPAMLLALLCAIELQPYRIPALIAAAAALGVQLSARAYLGEFGHDAGTMFFGGFLGGILVPIPLSQMQYIAPIVAVAAVAAAVVQVVLCRMRPATGLVHIERGFLTRTRYVVRRATQLVAARDRTTRATRKLRNEMIHLNEAAMLVDGYLASSGRPGQLAARLHRLVFDTELAAHALGRTVNQLCRHPLPDEVRTLLLAALSDLDRGGRRHDGTVRASAAPLLEWLARHEDDSPDPEHERLVSALYRFVAVLGDLHRAGDAWTTEADAELEADNAASDGERFTTPVTLVTGKLPGTNLLASRALASGGMRRPWNAWSKPNAQMRIVIQLLITLMIAIPLGDALSGKRFYWAMIGALIVLSNTDSPHERMRKTAKRVIGTLIGGLVGIGLANLLGTDHPMATLSLICVALAVGAYSISSYYSVWAGCLALSLIQLYSFTGGFKDSVIVLRAGENALGAVIATLVALVVLPIATRTLLHRAQASHVHSLATFVRESGEVWSGSSGAEGTREQARAVDQATHELHRFTRSLVHLPASAGHERAEDIRSTMRRAAVYAREMSVGSGEAVLTTGQREQLRRITGNLSDSIDALAGIVPDTGKVSDGENAPAASASPWLRSAEDIRQLQTALSVSPANAQLRHALHYLGYLDDLLGDLAARLDMPVQGSDYRTGARALSRELFALRAEQATAGQVLPAGGSGRHARTTAPATAAATAATLTAGPVGSVEGHLVYLDPDRSPAVTRLTVLHPDRPQRVRALDVSGDTFRINDLPPGFYQILATSPGRRPEVVVVSVTADRTTNCDFLLQGQED
ncbi:FUSC family protein [Streptomyces sp. NPDC002088]|uniref:FUSC family protein n=1 Tax=Streptomyces sp. NPDC002088 TaxID=3154665 RepID=UPI00332F129E